MEGKNTRLRSRIRSPFGNNCNWTERPPLNVPGRIRLKRDSPIDSTNSAQAHRQWKHIDVILKIILEINNAKDAKFGIVVLNWPSEWALNHKLPNPCLVNLCRNYGIHADVGSKGLACRWHLTVLDTATRPNIFWFDELPTEVQHIIQAGPLQKKCDAYSRLLRMNGRINLAKGLCNAELKVKFIVFQSLAAPLIMGADFCDWHDETIRAKLKLVQQDDGTSIPTACHSGTQATLKPLSPNGLEYSSKEGKTSSSIWLAGSTVIPPKSQVWTKARTERN